MSADSKRVADAVKPVLSDALSAQAYASLLAIPGVGWFFALPIISSITRTFIHGVTDWAIQETAVGLSVLWIQVELAYEIKSAEEAKAKLSDMLDNPIKYSEAEQQKISEYFDESTIDIIQLGLKRLS